MRDQTAKMANKRAIAGISQAEEKRLAKALSPSVAWPTLGLAVVLPSMLVVFISLGLTGVLSAWVCIPVLSYVIFGHYTLVHEAVHSNIVSANRKFAWVNTLIGWIGALGMGIGWPILQRTHILHHSHTNTEKDPDFVVKGTFLQLLMKWVRNFPISFIPIFMVRYVFPARYKSISAILSSKEIVQVSIVTLAHLVLLAVAIFTGHIVDYLVFWFIPSRIALLILNVFFQWLPHHPFDKTERYLNTRVSLFPGGTFLTFQQNFHLVHHLWPSVPFYNYARLFRAIKPVLVAEGSRVEGFMVGPLKKTIKN